MKNQDSNVVRMSKRDYFRLPSHWRQQSDGPLVLTMRGGRETFVPVEILE